MMLKQATMRMNVRKLLDLHDLKGVVLLFEAVLHSKAVTTQGFDLRLHGLKVAAGLQPQLQGGEHALLTEDTTGKGDAGDDIVLVVLALFHVEEHARRIELIFLEGIGGVGHVELPFATGCVDLYRLFVGIARTELLGQTESEDAVVHVGGMEAELTVTNQDLIDMRKLVEVVIDTLDDDHRLTTVIDRQCLILDTFRGHLDLRQLADLREQGIVGRHGLTGVTFSCGSKEVKKEATRSWKPLNTLSVTTRAIVATATPTTEMPLMTLMAWVDFFEKR